MIAGYSARSRPRRRGLAGLGNLDAALWANIGNDAVTLANVDNALRVTRGSTSADQPALRFLGLPGTILNVRVSLTMRITGWDNTLLDQPRWGPCALMGGGNVIYLARRTANTGASNRMVVYERVAGANSVLQSTNIGDPQDAVYDMEITTGATADPAVQTFSHRWKLASAATWTAGVDAPTSLPAGWIGLRAMGHPAGLIADITAFDYEAL